MGFFGGGASVDLASPSAIGSTTPNTGRFTTLTLAPSANTTPFTASGYSLTGTNAQSFFDLSGTWNTSGTPTAFKLNVTDTASNVSSLLMDLQVGGTSRASVGKNGRLILWGSSSDAAWIESTAQFRTASIGIGFGSGAGSGVVVANANSTNVYGGMGPSGVFSTGYFGFSTTAAASSDVTLFRDAANILAQRNSTNAQTFRLYRTFTDASNYERLGFIATRTTRFAIAAENAGTGAARSLEISFYTSASDPTSSDITSGCFSVWKNSGTGTIKLWVNDGGTMKSVALA